MCVCVCVCVGGGGGGGLWSSVTRMASRTLAAVHHLLCMCPIRSVYVHHPVVNPITYD